MTLHYITIFLVFSSFSVRSLILSQLLIRKKENVVIQQFFLVDLCPTLCCNALAGYQTQINYLEGSYVNFYTTNAHRGRAVDGIWGFTLQMELKWTYYCSSRELKLLLTWSGFSVGAAFLCGLHGVMVIWTLNPAIQGQILVELWNVFQ